MKQPRSNWTIVSGLGLLAALAALAGANIWLSRSDILPLSGDSGVDYLLIPRPVRELFVASGASLIVLIVFQAVRAIRRPGTSRVSQAVQWDHVSVLLPWVLLVLPIVAVGMLGTPARTYAGPWLFLFLDLRTWLVIGIAALCAQPALQRWATPLRQLVDQAATPPGSTAAAEVLLVAVLAAVALTASPAFRFQSVVIGDEPKYLRFDENWYRGGGMNIERFPDISQLPAGFQPDVFGNFRGLAAVLPATATDAAADLRHWMQPDVYPDVPRAQSGGGWFFSGRHGGIYQVHYPGFSLLLFPGYFIDRYFLNSTTEFHPQFPTNLWVTGATVLALYLSWTIAIFRLVRAHTGEVAVSWITTCVVMTSLPATAFSYQYYPEVAAGLVLTVLARFVFFDGDARAATSLFYGLLAGFLPWLHVRFGIAALVLVAAGSVTREKFGRTVWFLCGALIPLALLSVYTYYLSGFVSPGGLYGIFPDSPGFSVSRALRELPWFWLDRSWGLIAHAPVYLLALPGMLWCWRRRRALSVALAALISSLAVLSAAIAITGGNTTPLRLVAAVVPFLVLPLADALVRYRRSRWFLTTFVVLAVVSTHNGLTYNRYLRKFDAALGGPSISGWKTTLLLPDLEAGHRGALALACAWMALTIILLIAPRLSQRSKSTVLRASTRSPVFVSAVVLIAFAAIGSAVSAYTGEGARTRYMLDQNGVRDRVVRAYLSPRAGGVWSAERGRVDAVQLFPNPPEPALVATPEGATAAVAEEMTVRVEAFGPNRRPAWGFATVDFGDGSPTVRSPLVGRDRVRHAYAREGDYLVTVSLVLPPAGRILTASATVHIRPRT